MGVVFSALFLLWAFYRTDFKLLAKALESVQFSLFFPAIAFFFLSNIFRTFLWKALIGDERVRADRLFLHLMLGLMANNVLPARLGEFARMYSAGTDFGIGKTSIFSTIFAERLLDIVWLFAFTAMAFFLNFKQSWPGHIARFTVFLLIVVFFGLAILNFWGSSFIKAISRFVPQKFQAKFIVLCEYYLKAFLDANLSFREPLRLLKAVGLSLASWAAWVVYLQLVLSAFHIDVTAIGNVILTGIINLGAMIPSAPGYFGTFQFACIKGLELFDVQKETALAFSLLFHASWYVPTTALGALAMIYLGFNFKKIKRIREESNAF